MKRAARLLETIQPSRYRLELTPDLESFTFSGKQSIDFTLTNPSKELTFHSVDLDIAEAKIGNETARVSYDKENQTTRFRFDTEFSGNQSIDISYTAKLRDDLHGFYKSSYKDQADKERWLATTQFEPTAAREAFVCIDEPAAKAVFDVTLVIPEELEAISNTNIVESKDQSPKSKVVRFAPTPKMSTYLLAFLVGNFERITAKTEKGVEVGVYTTAGKKAQGEFALDVAAKTLDFYTDYFGIPYPLPKLDMIAVPDFAAGAMENWGAVTYRETAILADPKNTALVNRQHIAMVVAHELAHQWFGNLVTMAWWTDLWLNEGFASWVEYLAMDHLFPEWDMWTQFVSNDYNQARQLDSLANTHPIEVEVHHPDEIGEIFDAISYQKGASVIRMLYHLLGEATFKQGLHNYLTAFSYGNAVTNDLWKHLEDASGIAVTKIMQAWTKQPGFPLISLQSNGRITQKRFFADPKQKADDTVWPVPLAFTTARGISAPIIIDHAEGTINSESAGWEKPNAQQTGFYIVSYAPGQLEKLLPVLPELPAVDRLGVVSDVAMLQAPGITGSGSYLKLAAGLRQERSYAVWMSLLDGIGPIGTLIDDGLHEQWEPYLKWLVEPAADRLGWEEQSDDSHFDKLLRPQVLRIAAKCGEPNHLAKARELFEQQAGGTEIPADLRTAVYSALARHGGQDEYYQLKHLFEKAELQEEQRRLLGAMGSFKQAELLRQTLELSISDAVRSQDSLLVIIAVLMNRFGTKLAWQFVQDNWELFVERYGSGGHLLSRIPEAVGSAFARHDAANEIEEFFNTHDKPGIERTIAQALEQIRLQADWWDRDKDEITAFLTSDFQT